MISKQSIAIITMFIMLFIGSAVFNAGTHRNVTTYEAPTAYGRVSITTITNR